MKKVLIVVDYQNDFVICSLKSDNALAIKDKVEAKIEEYINNGDYVFLTRDTHDYNYLKTREGGNLQVEHCIENTTGHDVAISFELNQRVGKYKFGCYLNKFDRFGLEPTQLLELDCRLKDNVQFEVIGVATNICVLSVAVSLQNTFNNSDIYIDAECCASYDNELHEKALDVMEGLQFKVINRKK